MITCTVSLLVVHPASFHRLQCLHHKYQPFNDDSSSNSVGRTRASRRSGPGYECWYRGYRMTSGTSIVLFHFILFFFFFLAFPLPPPPIPSAAMDCAESNCDTRKKIKNNKNNNNSTVPYGNNIRSNPTGIEMAFTNFVLPIRNETLRAPQQTSYMAQHLIPPIHHGTPVVCGFQSAASRAAEAIPTIASPRGYRP
ncbi:hypothetical protein B9Z19DRAFT_376316 [Tuber borchii]|uniref:Uncharacterized protein n=1 Tax=Tuber borchii TaxID=42251 RepID=A0A2T6ZHW3_TUBBO|nr:hypothetical protein B9Z19DRAFT_376316 [Tuber borchii]